MPFLDIIQERGCRFISTMVVAVFLSVPSMLCADNEVVQQSPPPPPTDEGNEVLIAYTAPFHRVVLTRNFHITDTEEISEYADPVSSLPSRTVKIEKSTQADPVDVMELLLFIRESGFDRLKEAYGGRAQERGYLYTLLVQDGGRNKKIVYRSRPDAEARPKIFSQVENKIIEFAKKATEIKTGEVK